LRIIFAMASSIDNHHSRLKVGSALRIHECLGITNMCVQNINMRRPPSSFLRRISPFLPTLSPSFPIEISYLHQAHDVANMKRGDLGWDVQVFSNNWRSLPFWGL
jgi:hypothetical protein